MRSRKREKRRKDKTKKKPSKKIPFAANVLCSFTRLCKVWSKAKKRAGTQQMKLKKTGRNNNCSRTITKCNSDSQRAKMRQTKYEYGVFLCFARLFAICFSLAVFESYRSNVERNPCDNTKKPRRRSQKSQKRKRKKNGKNTTKEVKWTNENEPRTRDAKRTKRK